MKVSKLMYIGMAVLLATTLTVAPAEAQRQRGNRQRARNYDPSTVETVQGTVQEVVTETGRNGGSGIHLLLQAEGAPTEVHVGPASWLSDQEVEFTAGDEVTVIGSKTSVNGEPALIAREIKVGDMSLTLRDEAGIPVWRGQGRRGQGGGRGRSADAAGPARRGAGAGCPRRGEGGPRGLGGVGR